MPANVLGNVRVGLDGPDGFVCFLGCSISDIEQRTIALPSVIYAWQETTTALKVEEH